MSAAATVGVLGGSGVYTLDGLEEVQSHALETPFGAPSDALTSGLLDGCRVVFLPRHGRGHRLLPGEVPYRANLHAMKQLGVERLLSVSAVGSLCEEYAPGDFVLVDQFLDRTTRRVQTFFGDGVVAHVPLGEPVDAAGSEAVARAAEGLPLRLHRGGCYVTIEGPQFSTRAESELYRSWGCKVIGMTNGSEAKLAREAGMAFTTVAMVTDYDCWHPGHDEVDVAQVLAVARRNAELARTLVTRAVPGIAALGPSPWRAVLDSAVLTAPEAMDPAARARLALLLGDAAPAAEDAGA